MSFKDFLSLAPGTVLPGRTISPKCAAKHKASAKFTSHLSRCYGMLQTHCEQHTLRVEAEMYVLQRTAAQQRGVGLPAPDAVHILNASHTLQPSPMKL